MDDLANDKCDYKPRSMGGSFRCAGAGIMHMLVTQRNARIHITAATAALAIGLIVGISYVEWAIIILAIGVVLTAEAFNTVAEVTVDLAAGNRYHDLARIAKDVAAGAVLISAIIALLIGAVIFIPHILAMIISQV